MKQISNVVMLVIALIAASSASELYGFGQTFTRIACATGHVLKNPFAVCFAQSVFL
jgi:hypothetical protein